MPTDRVVLFERLPQGALQGVAGDDLLLVGGVKRGSGVVSIDALGNVSLSGASVAVNTTLDMTTHFIHNVANPVSAQDAVTKNYADTLDNNNIKKDGSVPFTGDESMGGHKLTNVAAPISTTDATNKTYVDTLDANDIKKDGSVAFTGDESMGGNKLTNVAAPAAGGDATNKTYVDTQEALDLRLNGSRVMTGALDMGTHLIHNVVDPVTAQDAATKNYVDTTAGGGGVQLAFADINYTGGVEGFTSIADVTGVTVTFTLGVAGPVQFFASGASLANPFIQGNYLGLAINVNGTDYYGNGTGEQGFNGVGGGNLVVSGFTSGDAITMFRVLNLSAGFYTVKLRAFGNGYLESSANFPTRLSAVYPVLTGPMAAASPLISQESSAAGPHNLNGGDPLTVVPGTTISVTVSAPQTVVVMAFGDFEEPGNSRCDGIIGVRVTKPGPTTVDLEGSVISGNGNDVNSTAGVCNRAVSIPAGTSTFDIYHQPTGVATRLSNMRLTVVYTVPQAVTPGGEAVAEDFSASDTTTSASFVATGASVNISLAADSVIQAKAFTTGVASGGGNAFWAVAIALDVDGTTYTSQQGFSFGNSVGPSTFPMAVFKDIALLAGNHTITLKFKKLANGSGADGVLQDTHLSVVYKV